LKFDASTSENDGGFSGYTLDIAPGVFATKTLTKAQTVYDVTGLTEGTVYTFTIKSKNGDQESVGATITWSPATRFINNVNGDIIKVYEYASSFGSGLDFYDASGNAPKVYTVANGAYWNIGLDTRTSGSIILSSPDLLNYNFGTQPGVTEISQSYFDTNDLNTVFDSQALDAGPFAERSIDLSTLDVTTGVVFICRVKEGSNTTWTYAKLLIKKTGGSFLQGAAPNRYLECEVSYQKVAGVPYAL